MNQNCFLDAGVEFPARKEGELKVDSEFLTILRIFLHVKKNH